MSDMLAQNDAVLAQCDDAIDNLVGMTGTMVTNAEAIGAEIKDQTEMAKGINDHMDKTNDGINKATDKMKSVEKTTKGSILPCILIIVFFIIGVLFFILAFMKKK